MTTATLTNIDFHGLDYQRLAVKVIARLSVRRKQARPRKKVEVQHHSFVSENLLDPNLGPEIRRIQR